MRSSLPGSRLCWLFGILLFVLSAAAVSAQPPPPIPDCNPALPGRLVNALGGIVTPGGGAVRVRATPGLAGAEVAQLEEGARFLVTYEAPACVDGILWWNITTAPNLYSVAEDTVVGWLAEGVGDSYFVGPLTAEFMLPTGELPQVGEAPMTTVFSFDLPAIPLDPTMPGFSQSFAPWAWPAETMTYSVGGNAFAIPDPARLVPPQTYAGAMPALPIDLSQVAYLADAGLSDDQLRVLAREGFVVVPPAEPFPFFERALWQDKSSGRSNYISTDMLLYNLYSLMRYTLMYLENGVLMETLLRMTTSALGAAESQYQAALGGPLEEGARTSAAYLAVLALLLSDAQVSEGAAFFSPDLPIFLDDLQFRLRDLDPAILALAQPVADRIRASEGQGEIPFLSGYVEDFGLYRPRSHYETDPMLAAYFRAVTWMGRVTFRLDQDADTLAALLLTRAMQAEDALARYRVFDDVLRFLIGESDNLGPQDYAALMAPIYGEQPDLAALADPASLAAFREAARQLPPPRLNVLILPQDTDPEAMRDAGRGLRLMGGRYTIDSEMMQRLMAPDTPGRALPSGLDVAAALGSDMAYNLALAAGADGFPAYAGQMAGLRGQVAAVTPDEWSGTAYELWLWALQPLLARDPAAPPLHQTDSWARRSITTALASWASLRNVTAAYVLPPAGLGGGGESLPLTTYTVVEANPLAFARIAIFSQLLAEGLQQRGLAVGALQSVAVSATSNARLAALAAEMARLANAGEPIPADYLLLFQEAFFTIYNYIRIGMEQFDPDPPRNTAMTATAATNPASYLQVSTGRVDYIYVVTDRPDSGLQLVRGGVFSYYEFVTPGGRALTDSEWRDQLDAGEAPPRPAWSVVVQ